MSVRVTTYEVVVEVSYTTPAGSAEYLVFGLSPRQIPDPGSAMLFEIPPKTALGIPGSSLGLHVDEVSEHFQLGYNDVPGVERTEIDTRLVNCPEDGVSGDTLAAVLLAHDAVLWVDLGDFQGKITRETLARS